MMKQKYWYDDEFYHFRVCNDAETVRLEKRLEIKLIKGARIGLMNILDFDAIKEYRDTTGDQSF